MKKGNSKVAFILCAALLFMGLSMLGVEDAGAQMNCYWCCHAACDEAEACRSRCNIWDYYFICCPGPGPICIDGSVQCMEEMYQDCLEDCADDCEDDKDDCDYANECGGRTQCPCTDCSCSE